MGPDDRADAPVEVEPEGVLLARDLAVEVDQAHRRQGVGALVEQAVGVGERVLDRDHVGAALEVEDRDVRAVGRLVDAPAAARHAVGAVVVGPQDPLVASRAPGRSRACPRCGCPDVMTSTPAAKSAGGRRRGEAHAAGEVLAVGGHEVDARRGAQPGRIALDGLAPRLPDDVADHQDPAGRAARAGRSPSPYFAYSTDRVSRMTVTLIWPGYVSDSSILRTMSRARRVAERSSISSGRTRIRTSRPAWTANVRSTPGKLPGDRLEVLEPLDVHLHGLAAGARARGADGVGDLHDRRLHAGVLDLLVVGRDRVHDLEREVVALRDLGADRRRGRPRPRGRRPCRCRGGGRPSWRPARRRPARRR